MVQGEDCVAHLTVSKEDAIRRSQVGFLHNNRSFLSFSEKDVKIDGVTLLLTHSSFYFLSDLRY